MGSKGSQTTNTNQTQTYAPAGYGYVQNALNTAQNAASLPFNIPQAPVAGFSQDQLTAFQNVNNAQGMAQPYFNQANNYFQQSAQGPNVSQFFNPYASAVTGQLQNIFGQQNVQNTGQLTQAAGGVGADRIAVGQANLANQQGLAAGQTLSGLYAPSLQAAQNEQGILQSAGYGTAALGSQAQNAALTGAQAQLGTGGLQQQLQQAQLNAPYQQQLAQAAFPYQQSQFLTGAVGALAPGLGGTTTGQGTTSSQYNPSIWGQIGGGLQALGGIGGYFGSNSGGKGTGSNTSAINQSMNTLNSGTGGAFYGPGFAGGGGVSDEPIDVAPQSTIPEVQAPKIQPQIPNLNLNPPQQQQQSGGNAMQGIGTAVQLASMFLKRGGAVNPYGFADGGDTSVINPDEPYRMPAAEDVQAWRDSADRDMAAGETANAPMQSLSYAPASNMIPPGSKLITGATQPSPLDTAQWPHGPVGRPTDAVTALNQFAPGNAPMQASSASPYAVGAAAGSASGPSLAGFLQSPWAALTAGGLEAMRTGSLASGFGTTMKLASGQREMTQRDESIRQAQERLNQQAKFHEDEYTRETMGQKLQREQAERPYSQLTAEQRITNDINQQKLQIEQRKPITINDPILGVRSAVYNGKDGYVYTDTGQPVSGPQGQPQDQAPVPPSDDPARPFKNAQPSTQTAAQAITQGLHGQAFLDAVPRQIANDIAAVANYDAPITIFGKMKGGLTQDKAFQLVRQMNPDYSMYYAQAQAQSLKEFLAGGPNSPAAQIRSYNTAVGHAGEAWDAIQEMKRADPGFLQKAANAGIPFASYVAAALQNAAVRGTPLGAALTKYQTAMPLYTAESAKLYAGLGSQEERNTLRVPLDPNKSLPEIEAGLRESAKMMGSRGDALQDQYKTAMNAPGLQEYGTKGELKDFPVLHEKAKATLEKMGLQPGGGGGATPAAAAGPPTSAVSHLKAHPELRDAFDKKYGPGAAANVLGQ